MGVVYRARDRRLDRDVAIKVLPESVARDPDRRERFEREAKAVAALSHPNILAIFDFGEHNEVCYAATELLQGATLRERLNDGPLPARKAIDLAVQVARGLAAAHDRGIIHRDLKPENLFLVGDGQLKILDFGLAKAASPGSAAATRTEIGATDPGTVLGTIGYMSPEQVRAQPVDGRTDLFSLGAVLYEMVTGQRTFERKTAADTMSAILREEPPDASSIRTDVPPALDRIIRHCLEKDPSERFQTARDVAFALSSLSAPATTPSGPAALAPAATRRPRWLLPAGVVGLAAAVGGFALGRTMSTGTTAAAKFMPKTAAPQAIFNARFMPDGQTIVFSSALTGSTPSLFESRPDATAPRPFGPPATHLLSISRSGELAVITGAASIGHRLMRGTLARMKVDGAPRAIADDVREADWLPDGSDLAVVRVAGAEDRLEFPVGQVVFDTTGYFSDPRVSPDGSRLAFMHHQTRFDDRGWVKVVDRSGKVTTLSAEFSGGEGIAWSADGRDVLFSATDGLQYPVFSVRADGGRAPVPLVSSAGRLIIHDVAPNGQLAAAREDQRYGVVALGAGQRQEQDVTPLDLAWIAGGLSRGRVLSNDGQRLVFTDGRSGHEYGAMLHTLDGSPPVRLGDGNAIGFSPDERWVTAGLLAAGRCLVHPTGAGATVTIPLGPMERCWSAVFFPDGRSLVLEGNERGKRPRAYRVSFPDGTPEPLLPEGQTPVLLSPSGRQLLARASGKWLLKVVDGGDATPLTILRAEDRAVAWSTDERSIIVQTGDGIPVELLSVDLSNGRRTKVGAVAPGDRAGLMGLGVHEYRDGGRQYVYSYERRMSVLFLVEPGR